MRSRSIKTIAIYALLDHDNAVRYIGQTADPQARLISHRRRRAWIKSMVILEWTAEANWAQREKYWIRRFLMQGRRMENKTAGGQGTRGLKHSAEQIEKNRAARLGKALSPEHKANIRIATKAALNTPEKREKWRLARLGKKHSEETKRKIGQAHRGQKRSLEARRKISIAASNRIPRRGWHHTEESKEKMRQAAIRNNQRKEKP